MKNRLTASFELFISKIIINTLKNKHYKEHTLLYQNIIL